MITSCSECVEAGGGMMVRTVLAELLVWEFVQARPTNTGFFQLTII
jgi:hypothetical protein